MKQVVVVKLGTKVLVSSADKIRLAVLQSLAKQIAKIHELGWHPIIVTSGAIACGNGVAGHTEAQSMVDQQVAAMVGQPELMAHWRDAFRQWGIIIGQGLGTHRDFSNADTVAAICRALELGIVPVLNENDFVSTEEIRKLKLQGDNDALAAIVAKAVGAEKLILLSDVDGLLDRERHLINIVTVIDQSILDLASVVPSERPTGMGCKLKAAQEATLAGITVHLANGDVKNVIIRIINQDPACGTTFLAH